MKSKKLFVTLIAVLLIVSALFVMAACSKKTDNNANNNTENVNNNDDNNNSNNNNTGNTDSGNGNSGNVDSGNSDSGNGNSGNTEVADKMNAAVKAIAPTVDKVAGAIKDGNFDAAIELTVSFSLDGLDNIDPIDQKFTLGTQASVDLLNKDRAADNKAIVYVKNGNDKVFNIYFEEVGSENAVAYLNVAGVKAAVNADNITSVLEMYGFSESFYEYSSFAEISPIDIEEMWGPFSGTIMKFLGNKLDEDGYITLKDNVSEVAAGLLPGLLSKFVDIEGILEDSGLGLDLEELLSIVKIGLRLNLTTDAEGNYLNGLAIELSLSEGEIPDELTEKIGDFSIPSIKVGLNLSLDLSEQNVVFEDNRADYTNCHILNGVIEGDIKLINKDKSASTYRYSIKADVDALQLLTGGKKFVSALEWDKAELAKLGKIEAVLKDENGKVIAEAFYDSAVNAEYAFAFIDYEFKGSDEEFSYYCTFDIKQLIEFSRKASNLSRENYAAYSDVADGGFDISSIMSMFDFGAIPGYVEIAQGYIDSVKDALGDIDVIDEQNNAIVVTMADYDAVMAFAKGIVGEFADDFDFDGIDAEVKSFIKALFGQDIDAISVSIDLANSGVFAWDITGDDYKNTKTNQANKNYAVKVVAVDQKVDIAFGTELPSVMDVILTYENGETETVNGVSVDAWTSFNAYALGEQTVYFVAWFDGKLVMSPFAVTFNVKATEVSDINFDVNIVPVKGAYTAVVGDLITDKFPMFITVDQKTYYLNKSEISCDGLDEYGRFVASGEYDVVAKMAGKEKTFKVIVAQFSIAKEFVSGKKFEATVSVGTNDYYLTTSTISYTDKNGKTVSLDINKVMTGAEIVAAMNEANADLNAKVNTTIKSNNYVAGITAPAELTFKFTSDSSNKMRDYIIEGTAGEYGLTLTYFDAEGREFVQGVTIVLKAQ